MAKDAPAGEAIGRGIYGQFLYINRNTSTVIVMTAADRNFRDDGVLDYSIDMFRQIAEAANDT